MSTWKEDSEGDGANTAKCSNGYHKLKFVKAIRENKDGEEFTTKKEDPYTLIVFENADGDEVAIVYTLNKKSKWALAKDLSRLGVDLDKMEADGITVNHFHDADWTNDFMDGLSGWAEVKPKGKYTNVDFYHIHELPPAQQKIAKSEKPGVQQSLVGSKPEVDEEDIPF